VFIQNLMDIEQEKLEKLKQVKNNDVTEFSLNNKEFVGKIVDVYDGDTCKVVFYLKDELVKFNCRLYGINAPELKPLKTKENRVEEIENGKKAKYKLVSYCCEYVDKIDDKNCDQVIECNNTLVKIKCYDWDKYGRLLVELFKYDEEGICFNEKLIEDGLVKKYLL